MLIPSINKNIGALFTHTAQKWFPKQLEKGYTDEARYAASMLVTTIVSKDIVGCFLYTYQSLHNKKIPEEKRKFVAALDLMNGFIMVFGQLLVGKIIDAKLTPKLLSKFTGLLKYKGDKVGKNVSTTAALSQDNIYGTTKEVVKEMAAELKINADNVDMKNLGEKMVKKFGKGSKKYTALETGFGIIITSIATTAITKRTITPLLSTPLAGWFKEKYMDKPKKEPETVEDRMFYQWVSLSPKYNNKMDKTPFSNVTDNK